MMEHMNDLDDLRQQIHRLRGNKAFYPDATIVVPVNAQKDLGNIPNLLGDLCQYSGEKLIEIVLVINNYPAEVPPEQIELYRHAGLLVIGIHHVEHVGGVAIAARIPGIRVAQWLQPRRIRGHPPDNSALQVRSLPAQQLKFAARQPKG